MLICLLKNVQCHSVLYTSCKVIMFALNIYLPAFFFIPVSDLQHRRITDEAPQVSELVNNVLSGQSSCRCIITATIFNNHRFLCLYSSFAFSSRSINPLILGSYPYPSSTSCFSFASRKK